MLCLAWMTGCCFCLTPDVDCRWRRNRILVIHRMMMLMMMICTLWASDSPSTHMWRDAGGYRMSSTCQPIKYRCDRISTLQICFFPLVQRFPLFHFPHDYPTLARMLPRLADRLPLSGTVCQSQLMRSDRCGIFAMTIRLTRRSCPKSILLLSPKFKWWRLDVVSHSHKDCKDKHHQDAYERREWVHHGLAKSTFYLLQRVNSLL